MVVLEDGEPNEPNLHALVVGFLICAVIGAAVWLSMTLVPVTESEAEVVHIECESDVAKVCEAVEFVEAVRGRAFKTFPDIEFMNEAEFAERLADEWASYGPGEPDIDLEAWQVLGLIEVDNESGESFDSDSTAGVLGIYLPDIETLWVRAGNMTLLAESVLVHELTHAHDDQWFDLDRMEFAMVNADRTSSIGAAIEGNAMRVEELWRASLSTEEQDLVVDQEFNSLTDSELAELEAYPEVILELEAWPYYEGLSFAEWVAEEGGEDAIDEMLRRPPLTTEQVFHPDAWQTREPPQFPKLPDTEYQLKGQGVLGELMLSMLLGTDAARGWGGDAFVLYESAGERCVELAIAADSPEDLNEIEIASRLWEQEVGGSSADVERNGEVVTLRSCLEVDP